MTCLLEIGKPPLQGSLLCAMLEHFTLKDCGSIKLLVKFYTGIPVSHTPIVYLTNSSV